MTRNELEVFAVLTEAQMRKRIHGWGLVHVMRYRREAQLALVQASQKGRQRLPEYLQHEVVQRLGWLERWCKEYFVSYMVLHHARDGKTPREAKKKAWEDWNQYVREQSY